MTIQRLSEVKGIQSGLELWTGLGAMGMLATEDERLAEEIALFWEARIPKIPDEGPVYCSNHDDGVTLATLSCGECQLSLCQDCDGCLHLPKAREP